MSGLGTGLPVCHLTTRGRTTGASRTVTLLYGRDGEMLVVAESNWGQAGRPAWALNLDAEPRATVAVDGTRIEIVSRRGSQEEEARWWPMLMEIWPGWDGYRRRAGREIALYALEPASRAASHARSS